VKLAVSIETQSSAMGWQPVVSKRASMESQFDVNHTHRVGSEAIEMLRSPDHPLIVWKLPDGRAIGRVSKMPKRSGVKVVSFDNWRWATSRERQGNVGSLPVAFLHLGCRILSNNSLLAIFAKTHLAIGDLRFPPIRTSQRR
jgi:hypothetical protein